MAYRPGATRYRLNDPFERRVKWLIILVVIFVLLLVKGLP